MSAKATGSSATPNGDAKSRDHSQGNQERKYTVEQKTAVLRVRKCSPTAFYDILGLEEVKLTCTDGEIKKAYRKLSLLTHPDKNGFDGSDEAFKMVSRAFQILSDPEKKGKFDKFGGDPDNRFSSASASSPFGQSFSRTPGSARAGGMWDEEISPEEMFNRFFSGGMGGGFGGPFGGGIFDTGPQFVFNIGGGPGIRINQFGGNRPRRRPHPAQAGPGDQPPSLRQTLSNLLPLLVLVVVPLISSLFSGSSTPSGPSIRFDTPSPPQTLHRQTPRLRVNYFVNPNDVADWSQRKMHQLDQQAEVDFVGRLRVECEIETESRQRVMQEAQGWFMVDQEKMARARAMELRSCNRLEELRVLRSY